MKKPSRHTPPPPAVKVLSLRAFTLIELLVVVLIIGVLAAVALPEYSKAVEKGRVQEAVVYIKTIKNAEERYFLDNGEYTDDPALLDVEIGCPKNFGCAIVAEHGTSANRVTLTRLNNTKMRYQLTHRFQQIPLATLSNRFYCTTNLGTIEEEKICSMLGTQCTFPEEGKQQWCIN